MKKVAKIKNLKKMCIGIMIFILTFGSNLEYFRVCNGQVYGEVSHSKDVIYEGEGFKITFKIDSGWDKGYIGNVVITNTSDTTIENWEISYESADEYSNIWNAAITHHSARIYHIKNAGHNQNIKPNESVSFGFQASYHNSIDIPKNFKLLGEEMEVTDSDGNVSYNVRDKWDTGCIIDVTIHNTSNQAIEDWSMQFDYSCKIDNIWRAKIDKIEGNTYYVKNCEYNSVIAAGTDETFGMQVSYTNGQQPEMIENIVLNEKKKQVNYIEFDKEWNRIMTRADASEVEKAIQNNPYVVKVAIVDSGIDYMNGINVVESENFVEECEESNPIFEDLLGHGTAVAGLMAYNKTKEKNKDGEIEDSITNETISGINPYINIYSARVLDEDNKTTIDRLIRGIEWAIENNVNIININCGVSKDNKELHKVIKKAYNKGILLIAAAGNGKSVQYPAKYSEVMAVGSIKCNGEKATDSACGEELEVVAPGQEVTSVGPFGILDCFSGSSMASPQVAALASILWQQDITKSNEFIRQLIDISANPLGDKESFGYGLIDCKCALEKYKEFEQCFSEKKTVEENVDLNLENEKIDVNSSELICVDEERVKGYWSEDDHKGLVNGTKALRKGATWPDYEKSKVAGMVAYPEFHGYFGSENDKVNYIKAYIFMTKVASNMYHKSTKKNINMNNDVWMIPESTSDSNYKFAVNIKTAAEAGFKKYKCKTKIQKSNFIYGMALHTVADIFAHSAYGISLNKKDRKELLKTDCTLEELVKRWDRFKHGPKDKNGHYYKEKNFADMKDCIDMRYKQSAKSVCNAIINNHIVEKQTSTKNKKGKNITKTDYQHTIGKVDVFKHVSYYYDKDNKNAWKYDKLKKKDKETDQEYEKRILTLKCNYVIQSYGLKNFLEYCEDCGADKDLKKLASNVDEDKMQELMDKWVQDEKEKAKEESKK